MVITTEKDGITINNYFTSNTDEEIALNISKIVAKLINRDLECPKKERDSKEVIA